MAKKAAAKMPPKGMPKSMPPKNMGKDMLPKGMHMMGDIPMKDSAMKAMMDKGKKKGK